jgi:nitrogen regulatory protein P-II 1
MLTRREGASKRSERGACVSYGEEVDLEGVSLPRFFTNTLGDSPKMKKLEAIIKPFKLEDVKSALAELGLEGMTVSEVKGFPLSGEQDRVSFENPRFLPKLKIELIVRNELLVSAIAAIKQSARTDRKDDGRIFVKDLVEVIRIRTEERGERAI